MPCCGCNQSWTKSLVGRDGISRQYSVQLNSTTKRYTILVNSKEIQHQLTSNFCSPLCGSGGAYEWQQDGHSFMLMYNNLGILRVMMGFRLFIDGVDVDTGLEFRTFFRRRGLHFVLVGLLLFAIGLVLTLVSQFSDLLPSKYLYIGCGSIFIGSVYMFIGANPFIRSYAGPQYTII